MKAITAQWFEGKVSYQKTMEDGTEKKVNETYVVDALCFAEAENRLVEYVNSYVIIGEFSVSALKIAAYKEVFFSEIDEEDKWYNKWYKAKVQLLTIDEKSGKEKRTSINYLVNGSSVESARRNLEGMMGSSAMDYVIVGINEMPIIDIFYQG